MRGAAGGVHVLMSMHNACSIHPHARAPHIQHVLACARRSPGEDLGPAGEQEESKECSIRTRSFGWHVRSDALPHHHDIWNSVSSSKDYGVGRVGRELRLTCHMRRLCYNRRIYDRERVWCQRA